MKKLTKKEYQQKRNYLLIEMDQLQISLNECQKILDSNEESALSEVGDKWNECYDLYNDLLKELKFLEDEWSRRNWTHSDFIQWDLITSNID